MTYNKYCRPFSYYYHYYLQNNLFFLDKIQII